MADADIGARGYCRHGLAISRLMQVLGWDKKAAHREFCWAVKVGDLRIKGKPEERPDFPADHYDHEHIYIGPPGGEDIYGRSYNDVPPSPTPHFLQEEYSVSDLERLIDVLLLRKNGSTSPAHSDQPGRESGGRPEDYPWEEVALCFGALLWDERAGENQESRIAKIQEITRLLTEKEPGRSTVQPRLKRWLEAYKRFEERQNAGN
jgi:hypothetical protein